MPLFALGALSLAVTLACIGLIRAPASRWGLLDRPGVRSLHQAPVPRVGGLAIAIALALCVTLAPWSWRGSSEASALLAGALVVALLGVADDRFSLPPLPRLVFQAAAAVGLVAVAGGLERLPLPAPLDLPLGGWGSVLSVLWIVGVINFYNFLDGIDGLAGLQAVITGLGLVALAWHPLAQVLGVALAGACLGFLVFNWAPARVFLGDAGSGLLGYVFAAAPFLAPTGQRGRAAFFVAMSLWLFLADAAFTLGRRMWRRQCWYEPHREHLYQRLVATGSGHAAVTLWIGLGSGLLTCAGVAAWRGGRPWEALALALALSLFGIEWLSVRAREARSRVA